MLDTPTADASSRHAAAIRVRGVTKEFGAGDSLTKALRGVDLDVPYGEMLMLVGPSGCGKTTLVSIVAGTLEPTAGEVIVLGQDLIGLDNNRKVRFRRENVGFVFQTYNLLPVLTAVENAAVPLLIAGWRRPEALEAAAGVLDELGLGEIPTISSLKGDVKTYYINLTDALGEDELQNLNKQEYLNEINKLLKQSAKELIQERN